MQGLQGGQGKGLSLPADRSIPFPARPKPADDTPADIAAQLNREGIRALTHIMFTHLDPDHAEGLRVIEQITLDFRTWRGRPEKQVSLLLPRALVDRFHGITTVYGPWLEILQKSGFVECCVFEGTINLGDLAFTAIRVPESDPPVFMCS